MTRNTFLIGYYITHHPTRIVQKRTNIIGTRIEHGCKDCFCVSTVFSGQVTTLAQVSKQSTIAVAEAFISHASALQCAHEDTVPLKLNLPSPTWDLAATPFCAHKTIRLHLYSVDYSDRAYMCENIVGKCTTLPPVNILRQFAVEEMWHCSFLISLN